MRPANARAELRRTGVRRAPLHAAMRSPRTAVLLAALSTAIAAAAVLAVWRQRAREERERATMSPPVTIVLGDSPGGQQGLPQDKAQNIEIIDQDLTPQLQSADTVGGSAIGAGAGHYGIAPRALGAARQYVPRGDADAAPAASVFCDVASAPLSTLGADVDTASYTIARGCLARALLPPRKQVRVEEFVNAFRYGDPEPALGEAFAIAAEVGPCPWRPEHRLARLTVQTRAIDAARVPPCNLVFLIDVSGSMSPPERLPLLVRAMDLLVDQLRPQDEVAIVTYANGVDVPLESAKGGEKGRIHAALAALASGGSTNGSGGLQRAYELARAHFVAGCNRVLLCTDGDFNVGISDRGQLIAFVDEHKRSGVFLTVLGVGDRIRDDLLEALADHGNGGYHYLDRLAEARRVLVEQFGASMLTVAKDVKLQVEFDPHCVARYRLLGYEDRMLAARDFRDDKKDGGELGAGHAVTALYELVPATAGNTGDALLTVRVRYQPPQGSTGREVSRVLPAAAVSTELPPRARLAATAAAFALLLRGDALLGAFGWPQLVELANALDARDPAQRELQRLVLAARDRESPLPAPANAIGTK
jgi:Ca-activated chloride channel family protein